MVDTTKRILEASLTWLSNCVFLLQAHKFSHSRKSMADLDSAVSSKLIEKVGNANENVSHRRERELGSNAVESE